MDKKIVITGAAGFIGFHLALSYLKDGIKILGIDNCNDYYSPKLKKDRLKILFEHKNFTFLNEDLCNYNACYKSIKKFSPDKIVHLAAQAGVRYSIENPKAYIDSNIYGFFNILEISRHLNIKGLIYASSSSVYGSNKEIPFSILHKTDNPISLYAASKKSNEVIAHSYTSLFGLHVTGLRFFTVYGPWGRPDMAMYIFADKISNNQPIDVFNNGEMKRDFTYIDDIVQGIKKSVEHNYKYEIFNLGNNQSTPLMYLIELIEKELNIKAKINFLPMQPGDVKESHADIKYSNEMINFNPRIKIEEGVKNFIKWHKKYSH